MNGELDFNEIKKIFDVNLWDVGFLSEENLKRSGSAPIKGVCHLSGHNLTSGSHFTPFNGIILARYAEETNDYSLYEESLSILKSKYSEDIFAQVYINFKEAALLSGIGSRAKNSLIYNRKFGFQCKFCAYVFSSNIKNYEILSPSKNLLNLCEGCDDCIKNCPVGDIHEDWIDAQKCDDFISLGNHPTIPSIKWFWYEKMKPDIPRSTVESWTQHNEAPEFKWGQGVDGYYELDDTYLKKDGVAVVSIPHCKECLCQSKCSKSPIQYENN